MPSGDSNLFGSTANLINMTRETREDYGKKRPFSSDQEGEFDDIVEMQCRGVVKAPRKNGHNGAVASRAVISQATDGARNLSGAGQAGEVMGDADSGHEERHSPDMSEGAESELSLIAEMATFGLGKEEATLAKNGLQTIEQPKEDRGRSCLLREGDKPSPFADTGFSPFRK